MSMVMAGVQGPYTEDTFQKHLDDFAEFIKEITLQGNDGTPEERRKLITEHLRFDEFCDSVRKLFGNDIKNQDLKTIYRKISTNPDAKVDWSELFGYFQSENETEEGAVGEEVNVFTVSARNRVGDAAGDRKRRDVVVCLKYIPAIDSFISGSQKAAVCVWSNKLNLQTCTEINEAAWLTGVDFLPNIRRAVMCTERSICVWDVRSKGKNQQVFSIKPIDNPPQCVVAVPYTKSQHEDAILYGDDQGYVSLMIIAAKDMNMKNSRNKKDSSNLTVDPEKLSYPIKKKKLHDDWVLKIKYIPELRCFASCSPSSTSSFVLDEVDRVFPDERVQKKKEDKWDKRRKAKENEEVRGVAIPKGVNAFDYCARANIIATGGVDKIIRVWHPHIWTRPTGKLLGHLFTIVDICCNEKDQHIISLSTARVIRVWDIHTLTSLQVFTDNEDRPGEKRIYCTLFDNKHDRLLTGSSVIDCWPLTRSVQDTMQVPQTHDRPLTQLVYNTSLNQIISVCTASVMKVWEGESGKLVYVINHPHGPGLEVTCIQLDTSGYRLATGAFDGSIKIWDFGSGQEIKHRAGKGTEDTDLSILGLQFCEVHDKRCLITLGWNNRLRIWDDSNDAHDLILLKDFNDVHYSGRIVSASSDLNRKTPLPPIGSPPSSGQVTKIFQTEHILGTYELTCSNIHNDLLVTGTTTGKLVFWNIPEAVVAKVIDCPEVRFPDGDPDSLRGQWTARGIDQDKVQGVTLVDFLVHKTRRLDPEFIKSLTKRLSDLDDSEDEDSTTGRRRSKRRSRASRASRYSRSTSRATSSQSVRGHSQQMLDQQMLEQLKAKIDGTVPKESGEEQTDQQVNGARGKDDEQKADNQDKGDPATKPAPTKPTQPEDDNPDAHMLVDTYDPVLISCHMDAYIRFWTLEGKLLYEMPAATLRVGMPVTAICYDEDVTILLTGDSKGYLTLWEIGAFLEQPSTSTDIHQVVTWRGHLSKVVKMTYIKATGAIISASMDGSVRVWWGSKGRFIGFLGQHRALHFPQSEETSSTPVLPYDINEKPVIPRKSVHESDKKKKQKYEYPLIFDKSRWAPHRKSAFERMHQQPEDKKFFESLTKPRLNKANLESSTTGEMRSGAVFRALPVYKTIPIPDKLPAPPHLSYQGSDDEDSGLFPIEPPTRKKSTVKKPKFG